MTVLDIEEEMTANKVGRASIAPRRANAVTIGVLIVSLFAVSNAAIFARFADAHAVVIGAFRVSIAALILLPISAVFLKTEISRSSMKPLIVAVGSGLFLALHFASWFASLKYTSVSNSVVLVTTGPVWLVVFGLLFGGDRQRWRGLLAVLLTTIGGVIIWTRSASLGGETLLGDALALMGAIFMAGYLVLGRHARQFLSLVSYAAVCYSAAGVALGITAFVLGVSAFDLSATTYGAMVALALICQLIGHNGFNWALKSVRPNVVAIALVGEPFVASLLAYIVFRESVLMETAIGGAFIIVAIYLSIVDEFRANTRS